MADKQPPTALEEVDAYAQAVVDGLVPAGKFHRLACERHFRDRAREGTPDFPYRFDSTRAGRFFRFAQQLRHYKGQWAGRRIVLQPYQKFRLGSLFGWLHVTTGLRRYRTAYNELPRKQGKTLEAAVVMLYGTFYDSEAGAEGYCIATKREQAKLVFNDATQLVKQSDLKAKITSFVANLNRLELSQKLQPLGADGDSTDGLNPHMVCVDEFHAHKDRRLIDVMETATGARRQPIFFQITTAGDDPVSPCGDQHDYACKVLEQALVDETFFVFIAHADDGDDWLAESTWQKANPNWRVSINPDDMRALATKAKGIPAAAATFKQKRLNIWVNATAPCLSMDGWRNGQSNLERDVFLASLEHESCYVGIDLASKIDLCALSFVFPPTPGRPQFALVQYIWTPEETLVDRAHRDRAPYPVWVQQGHLLTTPGTRVDHQVIREVLDRERRRFDIEVIGFDPWHADTLIDQLTTLDGFTREQVLEVPQTYSGMSSAESRFKAEVLAANVNANGCPVTAWAASNVVEQTDGKNNIFFTKKKSRGRIDPIKSATMGLALWLKEPPKLKYQVVILGARA